MRRFLLVYLFYFFVFFITAFTKQAHAITPTPTTTPASGNVSAGTVSPTPGIWIEDPNVTFVGKVAFRSGSFLDWTLQNYSWTFVSPNTTNPLASFWATIRNIVYILLVVLVLSIAFLIIITRGKNITVMRFIPQFIFMLLLITFSFAITQFLYQITDIVQGFFLKSPNNTASFISQKDLLQINFDYKNFVGYRRFGSMFDESAFMALLLVKLTAITYYVMIGVLLIRKIILWFFLIISPVFAVLIMYFPLRNTGKIWLGEFFRWLLYGPIFAIFLGGVVYVWRTGIPLKFNGFPGAGNEETILFPTAVNILLGGPGQQVSLTNSINTPETFAQYIVALLMLWVVILLPFLLLQIFLDYFHSFALNDNIPIKQFFNNGSFLPKPPSIPNPPVGTPPPPLYQPAGMARALPFSKKLDIPALKQQTLSQSSFTKQDMQNSKTQEHTEVLRLTNLPLPTMRDIARFETATLSKQGHDHEEMTKIRETLQQISQPENIQTQNQRQQIMSLKEQLTVREKQGNTMASAVLSAAKSVSQQNNVSTTTSAVSHTSSANLPKTTDTVTLPVVNRMQTVSLDDYEAVKKLWHENYQKLTPPKNIQGVETNRKTWIKDDIENINRAINLLTTNDPTKVKQGMDIVGKILPFLLIGGFSQTEIITYLKSKIEAAKAVLMEIGQKEEDEETTLDTQNKKEENKKVMHVEEEIKTNI